MPNELNVPRYCVKQIKLFATVRIEVNVKDVAETELRVSNVQ